MPAQLRQQATTRNRRPQTAAQPFLRPLAPWSILGPGAAWIDLIFPTGSLDWIINGIPPFRVFQTDELPTGYEWDGGQLRLFYDTIPSGTFDMLFPAQCATFRPPWGGWVDSQQHTFTVLPPMDYTATKNGSNNALLGFVPPLPPLGADVNSSQVPLQSLFETVPGGFQPDFMSVQGDLLSLAFAASIDAETGIRYIGNARGVFNWEARNPTTEERVLS